MNNSHRTTQALLGYVLALYVCEPLKTIPEVILDTIFNSPTVTKDRTGWCFFIIFGVGVVSRDQTQGTVSFPITVKTNVEGVEVGEGWREEARRGMVNTRLLVPPAADLAHLERLPPHHHHPLPHCRPAQPACRPHTHPRSHRPHCSPPALSRVADLLGTRSHQRNGLQEAEKGLIRRGGKRKAVEGQK